MSKTLLGALVLSVLLSGPVLILWVLDLTSVVSLSVFWVLSPLWIGWAAVITLGQVIIVWKYFRFEYWK